MNDNRTNKVTAEQAWQEYVNALDVANQSRRLQDGIAAGAAWRRFLDLFITPAQRDALGSAPAE